jgi:hypothetical protein
MIYLILALVIFLGYGVVCSIYEGKVIKSWSETYFSVSSNLFVFTLISTGVLTFWGYQSFYIFLSMMTLGLTASAPRFREEGAIESTKVEKAIHYCGAGLSMLFGFLEIYKILGLKYAVILLLSTFVLYLEMELKGNQKYKDSKLAWVEGIGFTIIMIHLIIFKLLLL